MPAGDGATTTRTSLACEWCGADLRGSLTSRVDEWSAVACYECVRAERAAVPATAVLYPYPRAEGAEEGEPGDPVTPVDVDGEVEEEGR